MGILVCPGQVQAQPRPVTVDEAAVHFARGQELYNKGMYQEAIKAFNSAQALSPHSAALFNIARCHENLGAYDQALEYYEKALGTTTDAAQKTDIKQRIQRLRNRPVKVFVSSQPSGAQVTVDGRAQPELTTTPMVVELKPGEHVLLFRLKNHRLAVERVVVQMGQERPVEVYLEPEPGSCPPRPAPCPRAKKCPELGLTDLHNLHMQASLLGAFGLTGDRIYTSGPGVQVYLTYRKVIVGTHFLYFPVQDQPLDNELKPYLGTLKHGTQVKYHTIEQRWLMVQLEAGYVFQFSTSYLYATAGVGFSADRVLFRGWEAWPSGDLVYEDEDGEATKYDPVTKKNVPLEKDEGSPLERSSLGENLAFAWSVGVGMEAFAVPWLSLGAGVRFGMLHGSRADRDDPKSIEDQQNIPYGTIWGTLTLHL